MTSRSGAAGLVADLISRGVRFSTTPAGQLAVNAPTGSVTPADLEELRRSRAEVLEILAVPAPPPEPPRPLPWRRDVAGWPIPDRERWGRLANRLADSGLPWPEDERQACRQIAGQAPA